MPAVYAIYKSDRLKYVRISGSVCYKELETLFYRYIRDPDFEPGLRILADLRGVTDVVSGLWEIRKLKSLYQYAYRDTVAAVDVVIVVEPGIAFRAARAFSLFMRDKRPLSVRVTNRMSEAMAMLKTSQALVGLLEG